MPERAKLLADLDGINRYGVLMLVQMGGVPEEIQLIFQTAAYDQAANGLRPLNNYIIRALGVREHKLSVGVFSRLAFLDEHPLLIHHNTPRVAVMFDGAPADVNEALLDLQSTYISTFLMWRHMVENTGDFNATMPLDRLLAKNDDEGSKMLGVMPRPLADRVVKVLAHHGLTAHTAQDPDWEAVDEHGRSHAAKLLLIDQSYVIALDFSVEQLKKKP
ncbi:MAG: hypothetical protein SF162_20005 [bacterium]|nr:hypothetical protein [bacterium]